MLYKIARRSARRATQSDSQRSAELQISEAQKTAARRARSYQARNPAVVPSSSHRNTVVGQGNQNPSVSRSVSEEREVRDILSDQGEQSTTLFPRPPKPARNNSQSNSEEETDSFGLVNLFQRNQIANSRAQNSSSMSNNTNPLSKLPLKGSGKGPKFPEYVTGISVQDYIEEVEDIVSDVPDISDDAQKKEALLRYLGSSVKRDWKALEGYGVGSSYAEFRQNILASYDHTETVSIKGLDEMLKGFRHVRVADLDRILDLKRAMGPYKKDLVDKNKISNREVVQKILKTIDEEFCASVWNDLARAERQRVNTAANAQGHNWTNDDPIGLKELLEELEMQARLHDSENRVMGTGFVGRHEQRGVGSSKVQVKFEQQENELSQLKDAFAISQKTSERRHQELLDKMIKMHQEIFTQKVSASFSKSNNNPSGSYGSQQQPSYSHMKSPKDVDGMIKDLICWFCGEIGHMSGRCLVRQKYVDEGKIILRGSTVCLPSGQVIYYTPGKDFQKVQVDRAIKETTQSNLYLTEEDFGGTPIEEVEAYLAKIGERKKMAQLIQQLRYGVYDEDDDVAENPKSVNIQTRSQKAMNHDCNDNAKQGF